MWVPPDAEDNSTARDQGRTTSLHIAATNGDLNLLRNTLNHWKWRSIDVADEIGWTPLMCAADARNYTLCEELIKHGAELNYSCPRDGTGLLHLLADQWLEPQCWENRVVPLRMLREWVRRGANFNAQNHNGETPLMIAALRNNIGLMEYLINEAHTDINKRNKWGDTALHYAAYKGNSEASELLLWYGADTDAVGRHGTPHEVMGLFHPRKSRGMSPIERYSNPHRDGHSAFILPPEVLHMICKQLQTAEDLCSLSVVCRTLNWLSSGDDVWKSLCSKHWIKVPEKTYKQLYLEWIRKQTALYRDGQALEWLPPSPSSSSPADHVYVLKMVVFGDLGVGKTSLIKRFVYGTFSGTRCTVGWDFMVKRLEIDGAKVVVQMWDLPGPEIFQKITKEALGAVIVYDPTWVHSFQHIHKWLTHIKAYYNPCAKLVLVGNKSDLTPAIDVEQAKNFAKERNMPYFETSAKNGDNVELAFLHIIKLMLSEASWPAYLPKEDTFKRLTAPTPQKQNACCLQ